MNLASERAAPAIGAHAPSATFRLTPPSRSVRDGVATVQPHRAGNEWSIELLRGLAALMVVYAHYYSFAGFGRGLLSFAFTGVDLFFVISGFVFAPYLFGRRLVVKSFLIRRALRLYPLYAFALCVYAGLLYANGQEVKHFVSHLLFLHTTQSREVAFHFNPAFWSLPPEVEFYLLLPLLSLAAAGAARVWGLAGLALALHLLVSYGLAAGTGWAGQAEILAFHLPGLLIEFMLGALAWWIVMKTPGGAMRLVLSVCGMALWLGLARVFRDGGDAAIDATWWLRGNVGLFAALAYALMLAAVVGWVASPPAWLRASALWLGNISFGVYLFHNAAPVALGKVVSQPWGPTFALLCTATTLGLAYLMHRFYEDPLRRWGRAWADRLERGVPRALSA